MGMVDAAIGIKTAVNFDQHKNRLGTYCAPMAVFLDPTFLASLHPRHVANGAAEIIKMACMRDGDLFEALESYAQTDGYDFQVFFSAAPLPAALLLLVAPDGQSSMFQHSLSWFLSDLGCSQIAWLLLTCLQLGIGSAVAGAFHVPVIVLQRLGPASALRSCCNLGVTKYFSSTFVFQTQACLSDVNHLRCNL